LPFGPLAPGYLCLSLEPAYTWHLYMPCVYHYAVFLYTALLVSVVRASFSVQYGRMILEQETQLARIADRTGCSDL